MEDPPCPEDTPSRLLETVLSEESVTVGAVIDRGAESGFGLLLILMALPTLIPAMVPGVATLIGVLYVLVGGQMLLGFDHPYLPSRLRARPLSARTREALLRGGVTWLRRIEARTRTRAPHTEHPVLVRTVAVLVVLVGIVLFLPVPFMNTLPAISVLVMGVGLLGRDGIVVLAGVVLATVLVAVSVALIVGVVHLGMLRWKT